MHPALLLLPLVLTADARTIIPHGTDSAAIETAIARAEPGDTIQLAAITYRLTKPLQPKSKLRIVGEGQAKTRLVYAGQQPGVLIHLERCEDVEIAEMTLDGQLDPRVQQGISATDSRRLRLHHLLIKDLVKSEAFGPHGILFSGDNPTMKRGVIHSRVSHCRIENIGVGAEYGGGIRLAWGCGGNVIEDNVIATTGRGGIFGDHSPRLTVRRNRTSGSGGEGLGIELWGGCSGSTIEDNTIDHWLSVAGGNRFAIRRNTIGQSESLKPFGLEIIASDCVVTGNTVDGGAQIGLSVSGESPKNNIYWADNKISRCLQWGAQLQGESGGIARHYFYHCTFEKTVRGDARALYPKISGHGFRTNGFCRDLVFDGCQFTANGGLGLELGGERVDRLSFVDCTIRANGEAAVEASPEVANLEFQACLVKGNGDDQVPPTRPFAAAAPKADFQMPTTAQAGEPVKFECTSTAAQGTVGTRLWDFSHGPPDDRSSPQHMFGAPGDYKIVLIVWDTQGRGARAEKTLRVLPHQPPVFKGTSSPSRLAPPHERSPRLREPPN